MYQKEQKCHGEATETQTPLVESCKGTFEYICERFWNLYTPDLEIIQDAYQRMRASELALTRSDKKAIIKHILNYRDNQRRLLKELGL